MSKHGLDGDWPEFVNEVSRLISGTDEFIGAVVNQFVALSRNIWG